MIHYSCDLCGAELRAIYHNVGPNVNPADRQGFTVALPKQGLDYSNAIWSFSGYDLCSECIGSLDAWLRERKEKFRST